MLYFVKVTIYDIVDNIKSYKNTPKIDLID